MATEYPARVAENILPLSVAQTLPEAFREWSFTEQVIDHLSAEADCELCNHEQLRYHFQIENEHTSKLLWVGSSCILKFQIRVFGEEEQELTPDQTKAKLNKIVGEMQQKACVAALLKLAQQESNDILIGALLYYEQNGYLTPKLAAVVFWQLRKHKIEHNPSFFKIRLKRKQWRKDLEAMESWRVWPFWSALTPEQRKLAQELGHEPPEVTPKPPKAEEKP